MPRLRLLRIPKTGTTNDDLRTLTAGGLPLLTHLEISGNPVNNEGFDLLRDSPFPALEALEARGCRFSDGHAWRSLAAIDWPSLRRLDLQDSLRDPRDLRAASSVLRRLEALVLSSCELDEHGAQALADIELAELTSLDVSYNELNVTAAEALANAALPRLREFHASVTPLGDAGVRALTHAAWWRSLEVIELVNVELTDEGLRALASSLPSTLRELRLGPPRSFTLHTLEALRAALPAGATLA
jgi:Ran GTPase-activating protein (RanGAP) involved in mRNA processing and transport